MNPAEAKFAEASLQMLSASVFRSCSATPNSEEEKNQYHYRLLFMYQGAATLLCDGSKTEFTHNSILFLPPNCPYQILNTHGNFTLLNLWFSFFPQESNQNSPCETQPEREFDPSLCAPRYIFTDAPSFNRAFLWLPGKYTAAAFLKIYNELSECRSFYQKRAAAELYLFLCDTLRTKESQEDQDEESPADKRIGAILNYIHNHITQKLDCSELADRFGCHPNHFNRMIKKATGNSAKQYILSEKMRYARRLRAETSMTLGEIAEYLGFFDYSHFSKCYKKHLEEPTD